MGSKPRRPLRQRIVARLERSVSKRGFPRTSVALIVALSGLAALLLSIVLRELGMGHMGLRYLLCLLFAYGIFLLLLRLLVSRFSDLLEPDAPVDLLFDLPTGGVPRGSSLGGLDGGGGGFGGGGASGAWGDAAGVAEASAAPTSAAQSGAGAAGESLLGDLDLDEGWVVAVPIALLVGALLAGGYVVTIAPVLIAEVAFDVAVAAGAYRAARRLEPRHWMAGALRRTGLAALALAALVTGVGFALEALAPGADTIGAALAAL